MILLLFSYIVTFMFYILYQQRDNNIYAFSKELRVLKILQHWLSKYHLVFSIISVDSELITEKNFHTFKFNEALLGNLQWNISDARSMSVIKNAKFIKKTKTDSDPNKLDYIKINVTQKFLEEFITFSERIKGTWTHHIEYFTNSLKISKDIIKLVIENDTNIDKIFNDELKQEKAIVTAIDNLHHTLIKEIMNIDYYNITIKELTAIFSDISIFFKNGNKEDYIIYSKIYNEYYRTKS